MLSSVANWVFYSRARLRLTVAAVLAVLVALAVLHATGGAASEPEAGTSSPSPTSTEPGAWLQPTETATASPSPSTSPSAADEVRAAAGAFLDAFTDRTIVAERWREEVTALSTPELGAALVDADPSRVPVLTGKPRLTEVGRSDAQATVDGTYPEGALRLTLTTDGQEWLVANVLPVE